MRRRRRAAWAAVGAARAATAAGDGRSPWLDPGARTDERIAPLSGLATETNLVSQDNS
ncbi:hypothetical protein AB0M02_39000 [Actinoplanes sp. NPDC051861]|uniref:hypothetical protein n=1 Tax=Actinoplanes sp. NPDC051861 TaxID=3155170 RepID=UPI003447E163